MEKKRTLHSGESIKRCILENYLAVSTTDVLECSHDPATLQNLANGNESTCPPEGFIRHKKVHGSVIRNSSNNPLFLNSWMDKRVT